MSKKPVLLFDFDGTIADSLSLTVEVFNQIAGEYHIEGLTKEKVEILRNKSILEVIQYLGIPRLKLPFFINKAMHIVKKNMDMVYPIKGIE